MINKKLPKKEKLFSVNELEFKNTLKKILQAPLLQAQCKINAV